MRSTGRGKLVRPLRSQERSTLRVLRTGNERTHHVSLAAQRVMRAPADRPRY